MSLNGAKFTMIKELEGEPRDINTQKGMVCARNPKAKINAAALQFCAACAGDHPLKESFG